MKQCDSHYNLDLFDQYCREIDSWNKTHKLYGDGSSSRELLMQSVRFLEGVREKVSRETLIDIGAGGAFISVAWLGLDQSHRVIAVEPKKKSHSWLRYFFPSFVKKNRFKIINARIQDVARETVDSFSQEYLCVARAFSGPLELKEAYDDSIFAESPLFPFEVKKT